MKQTSLTKEEQILKTLAFSGTSITNKFLMEKFGVNENYLVSLRTRIKNENIDMNQWKQFLKEADEGRLSNSSGGEG